MWFSLLSQRGRRGTAGAKRKPRPRARRLRLEVQILEDRLVLTTWTVTNLSDHDPGSLRDRISVAQNGDTINFQAGLSGTITLTSGELQLTRT